MPDGIVLKTMYVNKGPTITTINSKIENLELQINEEKDEAYKIESITTSKSGLVTFDIEPQPVLSVSSSSKVYSLNNVIDKNAATSCQIDKNVYNSNGTYRGINGDGESIFMHLPTTIKPTRINITNGGTQSTTTQVYTSGHFPSLQTTTRPKNDFYARKVGVYGLNGSSWEYISTINNTEDGIDASVSTSNFYSNLRFVIEEINTIQYTYEKYYYFR